MHNPLIISKVTHTQCHINPMMSFLNPNHFNLINIILFIYNLLIYLEVFQGKFKFLNNFFFLI